MGLILLMGILRISHGMNLQTKGFVVFLMSATGLMLLQGEIWWFFPILAAVWFSMSIGHGRYFSGFTGDMKSWNEELEFWPVDQLVPRYVFTEGQARKYGTIAMTLKGLCELTVVGITVSILVSSWIPAAVSLIGASQGLLYGVLRWVPPRLWGDAFSDGSPNRFRIPEFAVGCLYGIVFLSGA